MAPAELPPTCYLYSNLPVQHSDPNLSASPSVSPAAATPTNVPASGTSDAAPLAEDESGDGQLTRGSSRHYSEDDSVQLVDAVETDPSTDSGAKLKRCQQILEYSFRQPALLHSALTHASGASHRLASNERLEFLGDAVLGMIVCQWLFEEYPEYSEGDLTKIKSAVVSRRSCGKTACKLGLDQCLIVGRGVTRNRSYPKSLVSDVFEAVVAALYLDGGHDLVRDRLKKWLADEVRSAVDTQGSGNHKSVLQQYAQRELAATPVYRLIGEVGPDHRKSFLMGAQIGERSFTPAWGNNKKDAEQRAAANALAELHDQPAPHPSDPPPNAS